MITVASKILSVILTSLSFLCWHILIAFIQFEIFLVLDMTIDFSIEMMRLFRLYYETLTLP